MRSVDGMYRKFSTWAPLEEFSMSCVVFFSYRSVVCISNLITVKCLEDEHENGIGEKTPVKHNLTMMGGEIVGRNGSITS